MVRKGFATRRKVYESLERLLDERAFADIVVCEIWQGAGISRATFYRHFDGKDDVVRKLFREFSESTLEESGRSLTWYQGNLQMTQYLYEAKNIFTRVVGIPEEGLVPLVGWESRVESLVRTIEEGCPKELDDELRFEITTLSRVEPMLMTKWISEGMVKTPEQMAQLLEGVCPPRLHSIMQRLASNGRAIFQ